VDRLPVHELSAVNGHCLRFKYSATAAAEVVAGVAIFPNFTTEERARGFTDFNDLETQNPEVVSHQLDEAVQRVMEQDVVATRSVELAR
jgi:phage/plasmid primase-like uncharacterized protein